MKRFPLSPSFAALRRIRQRRGLTIEDLAAKLKRSATTVHQWEQGWSRPTLKMLEEWIDALGAEMYMATKDGSFSAPPHSDPPPRSAKPAPLVTPFDQAFVEARMENMISRGRFKLVMGDTEATFIVADGDGEIVRVKLSHAEAYALGDTLKQRYEVAPAGAGLAALTIEKEMVG